MKPVGNYPFLEKFTKHPFEGPVERNNLKKNVMGASVKCCSSASTPKAKNIWVNHHLPTSMYGIKNETNVGKYTSHMDPVGYRTHHLHLIDFSHFCLAWHAKRFPAWLPPLMTSKKNEEPDFVWRIRNEKNAKL